ncbi:MAG: N-formylglutamate amidohydrolase, partial [Bdellovibrionales bacterium]|nr:N-formylglutamate amidohydrolase [Bdellovibrionales bacterium]
TRDMSHELLPYTISSSGITVPLFGNIPHSSDFFPSTYHSQLVVSERELEEEHRLIVDWYTDELFSSVEELGGKWLRADFSRLLLDTERYESDEVEPMAARGVGVIYEKTCHQKPLRRKLSVEERDKLLRTYYRPYHQAMLKCVEEILERFDRCLIVDCHSFPEHVLPYEPEQALARPDICLGTLKEHTPREFVDELASLVGKRGLTFAENEPFAGSIVPLKLYGDTRVSSVMIEVNRKLYMDESTGKKIAAFSEVQSLVHEMLSLLAQHAQSA